MAKSKPKMTRTAAPKPLVLHAGIIVRACSPGFHMQAATIKAAGLQRGFYLQVEHPVRDTCIVRELLVCNCGAGSMRKGYIYMDEESARYLNAEPHEKVQVRIADYELETP